MDRTNSKINGQHGLNASTTNTQSSVQPKPIYGTSIDYQERAKRLKLTGPPPENDLNPFNAPTVNAIETMFERVLAIAKSSASPSQPTWTPTPLFTPSSSTRTTFERHQTRPEERDTIASTSTLPRHTLPKHDVFALSPNNKTHTSSTIALHGHSYTSQSSIPSIWSTLSQPSTDNTSKKATGYRYMVPPPNTVVSTLNRSAVTHIPAREEPHEEKLESVHQLSQPTRTATPTQIISHSIPLKRPHSPEPPVQEDTDDASDEDVVEILSSDDEGQEQEFSAEDDENYSYSEEEIFEDNDEDDEQHDIMDDDNDIEEEMDHKGHRWTGESYKVHLKQHKKHYQSQSQETEASPENSQDEGNDVIEEEYDEDRHIAGLGHDIMNSQVLQEESRHQQNENDQILRGLMGTTMEMGILNAPRLVQRHPLGPLEPVELEVEEYGDGYRAADDDDVDGVDEHVQDLNEEYTSDEEPFEENEASFEDDGESQDFYDNDAKENVLSDGENEGESPTISSHQLQLSSVHDLQENMRHLENSTMPREKHGGLSENVVLLLDSDEDEEAEDYPQDESEIEDDAIEQEELELELEYDGDSQDDQGEEEEEAHEQEYEQDSPVAPGHSEWDEEHDASLEDADINSGDNTGTYTVDDDPAIQNVEDTGGSVQEESAFNTIEGHSPNLQGLLEFQEPRKSLAASSSSNPSESRLTQFLQHNNTPYNMSLITGPIITHQNNKEGSNETLIEPSISLSSPSAQQDEENHPQTVSIMVDSKHEQQLHPMDSNDSLSDNTTVHLIDYPSRIITKQESHLPADIVMTEMIEYRKKSSDPHFDNTETNTTQKQSNGDLSPTDIAMDDTENHEKLQQTTTESDSLVDISAHQAQLDEASSFTAPNADQVYSSNSLVEAVHTQISSEGHLDQSLSQSSANVIEKCQQISGPSDAPLDQIVSSQTSFLDRLQTIAQEENITLHVSKESTIHTSGGPFSTASVLSSDFMQPSVLANDESTISPHNESALNSSQNMNEGSSDLLPSLPRKTRLTRMSTIAQTVRDGQAFMEHFAAKLNTVDKSDSASTIDQHSLDASLTPVLKRSTVNSSHTRTAANIGLLVKEAREFCAGGPSRIGSSIVDEEPTREAIEETTGQSFVGNEDRISSTGSQPSTPHKSGVVDLVAELVIQSKLKGHHALRVNPASPGKSPIINIASSRSNSQEPSVTSPMTGPLPQPPPSLPSVSAFTFGQGSPSKSSPASPSVGFGFGMSFVGTTKDRRTSIGSSSSRSSPRKSSGLNPQAVDLEYHPEIENVITKVIEEEEAIQDHHKQTDSNQEMKRVDKAAHVNQDEPVPESQGNRSENISESPHVNPSGAESGMKLGKSNKGRKSVSSSEQD
ncbi:hypothetical protein FBU30_004762 [Linnemannia zychae]|nr:hypothetical protein FBU30_004762 [Linnemannia zychae]